MERIGRRCGKAAAEEGVMLAVDHLHIKSRIVENRHKTGAAYTVHRIENYAQFASAHSRKIDLCHDSVQIFVARIVNLDRTGCERLVERDT